jgi:hypothetical protein
MLSFATTRITVYRGQITDEWGDTKDVPIPHLQAVPASLTRPMARATPEASGRPHVIQYATCRVTAGTDITSTDVVLDEVTGETYQVMGTIRAQHPAMRPDLRLNLIRVE